MLGRVPAASEWMEKIPVPPWLVVRRALQMSMRLHPQSIRALKAAAEAVMLL
jgi:hypothetical protein